MRGTIISLVVLSMAGPMLLTAGTAAVAQQGPPAPKSTGPRLELSLGFEHGQANAPPGTSDYFGLNGGYVSVGVHVTPWLSFVGDATGTHANDISILGQNLTLMTFNGGPRFQVTKRRLTPYAQALFGAARGSDSYFPTGTSYKTSATSLDLYAGGGLEYQLSHRFAIRAVEVDLLRTMFPNGSSNDQNHLMLSAGIVVKWGEHTIAPPPVVTTPLRLSEISFTCSASQLTVPQGSTVEITGYARTEPDQVQLNYSWDSSGGVIEGVGRRIRINTAGLAVGDYKVMGHASLASTPSVETDCTAPFHVVAAAAEVKPAPANNDDLKAKDIVFHENVADALFNYDSAEIRPDAKLAIEHAAQYLKSHPEIGVLIEGYADDRGSAEYNLALGAQRAQAAREALIGEGISADRLQIISFGKEAQVCTVANEACWQQNRRAAFSMRH